jgi:hypothetical protein
MAFSCFACAWLFVCKIAEKGGDISKEEEIKRRMQKQV